MGKRFMEHSISDKLNVCKITVG